MEEQAFLGALSELRRVSRSRLDAAVGHQMDRSTPRSLHVVLKRFKVGDVTHDLHWFERRDVPEGLDFEDPPAPMWEFVHEGRVVLRTRSRKKEEDVQDYADTIGRYIEYAEKGKPQHGELANLQSAYQAAEREAAVQQEVVDELNASLRRVLSTWAFIASHLAFGGWPRNAGQLSKQYSRDLESMGLDALRSEENESGFFNPETYKEAQDFAFKALLISQANLLWDLATRPNQKLSDPSDLHFILDGLGRVLNLPAELTRSTYAGLLYYAGNAVTPLQKLERLKLKAFAYKRIRRGVLLDEEPSSWKEVLGIGGYENDHGFQNDRRDKGAWTRRTKAVADILLTWNTQNGEFTNRPGWEDAYPIELFRKVAKRKGEHLNSEHPGDSIRDYFKRNLPARGHEYPDDMKGWHDLAREWAQTLPQSFFNEKK